MDHGEDSQSRHVRLLQQAHNADEVAAVALVSEFLSPVLSVLKRNFPMMHRDDRESMFHDALFKFIQRPSLFDPARGELQQLLFATACNKARDMLRAAAPAEQSLDRVMSQGTSPPIMPFFDHVAIKEEHEELWARLNALKRGLAQLEQEMIELFLDNGMSGAWAQQLAKRHKLTANVVAQRWRRLRRRIKHIHHARRH